MKKLFNRDFTLLWLGQSVSQLGNGAGYIGLMWWIQITTGSALALGTLALVQTLVAIIAAPFAGVLADRTDRRAIIVLTDVARGAIYLTLALLAWTGQLTMPIVYGAGALNALCAQLFGPAISASIPTLVPDSMLEKANSLNQVTATMVNIVGFGIGGILVAALGIPALLFIDGISFLLSAVSEMFIRIPRIVKEKAVLSAKLFFSDIKEGFAYMKRTPILLKIMQVAAILNFFAAPFFLFLPKFVNEYMGAGSDVYGYIMSAGLVGSLLTIIVMSTTNLIKRNLWIVRWGLLAQGAAYIMIPFLPPAYWGIHLALFAVGGALNAVVNIYFSTLLQRITPPEYMGKVFGLVDTLCQGLRPASQGLSGIAAEVVSLPILYTVCNAAMAGGGLQFALIPGLKGFLGDNGAETGGVKTAAPATA